MLFLSVLFTLKRLIPTFKMCSGSTKSNGHSTQYKDDPVLVLLIRMLYWNNTNHSERWSSYLSMFKNSFMKFNILEICIHISINKFYHYFYIKDHLNFLNFEHVLLCWEIVNCIM